jgi:predicted ATPase
MEPAAMRTIQRRSEGNPLFAEEIVRHLIESESVRRDDHGNWAFAPGIADFATLRSGVITARIDGLAEVLGNWSL